MPLETNARLDESTTVLVALLGHVYLIISSSYEV